MNKAYQALLLVFILAFAAGPAIIVRADNSLNAAVTGTDDRSVPRVMFWWGKVNQHWDLQTGAWLTDSDGISGARENKLAYCQKFYPSTVEVVAYQDETTNTWKNAGNLGDNFTSTKMSYRCVLNGQTVSGDNVSNQAEKPSSGSVCYYFPKLPLCLPLSDPNAIRDPFEIKLDNFVSQGVDTNTVSLGQGERVAVLKSYQSAFNSLPATNAAYADLIKISDGQWPSQVSPIAERMASSTFQRIYRRAPSSNNKNDVAAVKVMAYGLRQKASNRNLASEAASLKTFKAVYNRLPTSTADWNALQAMAYSGATK
jgi:hypothetical protein